jgi:low affinity Fe/Cu permease
MKRKSADRAEAAAVAEERADEAAERQYPFRSWFGRAATRVSEAAGSAWVFLVALALIIFWAVSGPVFGFSDTWQLVANTFTTLVTFLMVFLIQNTQNRDAKATQLKLDELIRAIAGARNQFIGAESDPEDRLKRELKEVEAERDKPSAQPRHPRGAHDGRPHNGEPAEHH